MALAVADRVKETSTTAGTGTLTLLGAVSGYQSFSVIGSGNTTYYCIVDDNTGEWEVGVGTYTSPNQLSRDSVLSSSSGGSAITFLGNIKQVFVTYPAERSVYENAAGSLVLSKVEATTGIITNLTSTSATITNLSLTSLTLDNLNIASANITTLTSTNATAASLTVSTGNLTFSSTAQRITGDMTNATIANRLAFQSSVTNGTTSLIVIPNGTATGAQLNLETDSAIANGVSFQFIASPTLGETRIQSGIRGTGSYLPLTFYTGGSERMRLSTAGDLGLGATPSGSYKFEITGGTNQLKLEGAAQAAITLKKTGVNGTTLYTDAANNLVVYRDGVGATATFDSSGNVGIGTTSPSGSFQILRSSDPQFILTDDGTSSFSFGTTTGYSVIGTDAAAINFKTGVSTGSVFTTGDTRMTIDSSGNVGIGGTADATTKLQVTGTLPTSGTVSRSILMNGTIPSGSTFAGMGIQSILNTQAASFTAANLWHFNAAQGTIGAGSSVTNQMGFYAESSLTGATNNFGFYSDIASGSNRWNFYANGTAANYFAGDTGIGTTTIAAGARLHIVSSVASNEGILRVVHTSTGQNSGATFLNGNSTNGGRLAIDGVGGFNLVNGDNSYLLFGTNNTERMRIDSSGNVGIGTASPGTYGKFTVDDSGIKSVYVRSSSTNFAGVYLENTNSATKWQIGVEGGAFNAAGTLNIGIDGTGSAVLLGTDRSVKMIEVYSDTVGATNRDLYIDDTGLLGYVSSIRASKTNIQNLADVSWLKSLTPVSYQYRKKDADDNYTSEADGGIDYGLIAEDVEAVAPELCFYDIVDGNSELRGVTYSKLITPMLKYIQQLESRIAALEAK